MGQAHEGAPTTNQSPSIPASSLLIVDDNRVNRIMLSRYITKLGYQAALAENGRQALEKLQAEPFDLVLLDVQMPEMDGYQVLEQLKAVLFYSDGLVEAHNVMREMFGLARLQRLIAVHPGSGVALIHCLLTELTHFTGAAWEQEDDITLVTLQHAPAEAS